MVEQILGDYAAAYGLRYVSSDISMLGADPDGELGEKHDPETHLIPRALLSAGGGLKHLSIYGDVTKQPTVHARARLYPRN